MSTRAKIRRARWRDQSGVALVVSMLVLLVLLSLGAGALLVSALDLKAANSDSTGHQAFFVAEAGIQHALSSINRVGVIDFQNDIVNCWTTCADPGRTPIWGANPKSMPALYAAMQYSAQVVAGANPVQQGTLTSTGTGYNKSRRVIRIGLQRGPGNGSPGALYAASDRINPQFSGNSFFIDGNDYDLSANRVAGGVLKPGVSTRDDDSTHAAVNALNNMQKDNVQGLGFSLDPLAPSVMTTGGPSTGDLDRIVNDLLAKPHVNWPSDHMNGGDVAGTIASPQITYFSGDATIGNGHSYGAGAMVVNGSLTINGTFDFVGWIIVRGSTTIENHPNNDGTWDLGSGNLLGSLWTGDFNIKVGGNANILYSSAGMALADASGGGQSVPAPMVVTSWEEVY